jgi:hypothetical protein
VINKEPAFGGTVLLSFSLMSQNSKSSGNDEIRGSFLFRHCSDAQAALQQSPILQSDMDKVKEMNYNGKREVMLRSVLRRIVMAVYTVK